MSYDHEEGLYERAAERNNRISGDGPDRDALQNRGADP